MFFSKKPVHKGKVLQTRNFIMQPLTVDLEDRHSSIVDKLVEIFSDPKVFRFNKNRQLPNKEAATMFVLSTLLDYEKEEGFNYFIFRKDTNELVGTIHLIPPKSIKKYYPALAVWPSVKNDAKSAWMIEFYLSPTYWGKGIMSLFVNEIIKELYAQGAKMVLALVEEQNEASKSMLKKLNFRKDSSYKDLQNQYLWLSYGNSLLG